MKKLIIIVIMILSLSGCSVSETCGEVTSFGTNWNGGYVIIEGNLLYVNDLLFAKITVGDWWCIYN